MTHIPLGLSLLLAPTLAFADVVTLECKGTNPSGEEQTVTVRYDEEAGWVDDNGVIKITDGVHADQLRGMKIVIDRKTGKYKTARPKSPAETFQGACEKMERKF